MATFGNHFATKSRKENYCEYCDYSTSNKYDFAKHSSTVKHQFAILATKRQPLATNIAISCDKSQDWLCKQNATCEKFCCDACGRKYKDKSGLWKHNKKCTKKSVHLATEENMQIVVKHENDELKFDNNEFYNYIYKNATIFLKRKKEIYERFRKYYEYHS